MTAHAALDAVGKLLLCSITIPLSGPGPVAQRTDDADFDDYSSL